MYIKKAMGDLSTQNSLLTKHNIVRTSNIVLQELKM